MYQTIREYQTDQKFVSDVLTRDEKSFVPYITNAPGFVDYTCIDSGNGTLVSVSIFDNRANGEKFNTLALSWVRDNLGAMLPQTPRVFSGEVHNHATGKVLVS